MMRYLIVHGEGNNFVGYITWHRKREKDNSAKFLSRVSEYILVFTKDISKLTFNKTELDKTTLKQYTNLDDVHRGNYRKLVLAEHEGSILETIWINLSNTANAKDEIKSLF
ncbi:hypothetical protein [Campylobacter vulpis]|nr:hypothetical protein [Campylobacter vulpis]MBS4275897.1 hypothetical protein [Campylobacter vulpis]MBS4307277.1 hypothetical protein [Campylobacter vulpis]MBS4330249.1 hypothetical protein [Campylobacter vulpis]MBS4423820.1 hypothetical protein [Campylobacter vulpis]PHY90875.1 hypothetical protein AA995_04860 [Campylobacter vulpis]